MSEIVTLANGATAEVIQGVYGDNAKNRQLGRVGQPYKKYKILTGPTRRPMGARKKKGGVIGQLVEVGTELIKGLISIVKDATAKPDTIYDGPTESSNRFISSYRVKELQEQYGDEWEDHITPEDYQQVVGRLSKKERGEGVNIMEMLKEMNMRGSGVAGKGIRERDVVPNNMDIFRYDSPERGIYYLVRVKDTAPPWNYEETELSPQQYRDLLKGLKLAKEELNKQKEEVIEEKKSDFDL